MLDLSSDIFSGKYLPSQWERKEIDVSKYEKALNIICPNMDILGQLTRSTNTVSFVLKSSQKLFVCQFAPPNLTKVSKFEEKNNPNKFQGAQERMAHLNEHKISVPEIILKGETIIDSQKRQYIVMNFVDGISADRLLARSPESRLTIYHEFGRILSKLSTVPIIEPENRTPSKIVLDKVNHAAKYILNRKIISQDQFDKLIMLVNARLTILGEMPLAYVHLDPSPTNLHIKIQGTKHVTTLMDIEAIQIGHPIIEGLGRAIMTGIYDWSYITNGNTDEIQSNVESFLSGYSEMSLYAKSLLRSKKDFEWLLQTCRIIHLPQSIMYEDKKDTSLFNPDDISFNWSIDTLQKLITGNEK
ncbi:MAG: phosphotransferase [bacterium]|nr:MAG: phosphotransferase [bacterium]